MMVLFLFYTIFLYWMFSVIFIKSRKKHFGLFLFRTLLVSALFVIPDKLAVVEISEVPSVGLSHNFLIYYILSFPLVEVFNAPRAAMVSVSNAITFTSAVWVVNKLKLDSSRDRTISIAILALYPDILYFSAFSVRDPAIASFSLVLVFMLYQNLVMKTKLQLLPLILVATALFSLRPEVLIWIVSVFGLFIFAKKQRPWPLILSVFVAAIVMLLLVEFIGPQLIMYVGLVSEHSQLSGTDVWRHVVDARYIRQFSDSDGSGSTSALVSWDVYMNLSNVHLLAIQLTSFLTITLSGYSMLSGLTVATGVLAYALSVKKLVRQNISTPIVFLALSGLLSFMIYAPFAVNGGNIFRMRLPLVSLCLLLLVIPSVIQPKTRGVQK
jgi:hypothetical protein